MSDKSALVSVPEWSPTFDRATPASAIKILRPFHATQDPPAAAIVTLPQTNNVGNSTFARIFNWFNSEALPRPK
jgi:hypothetical protein